MVYMLVLLLMLDGSYKEELKKVLDFFFFFIFFFLSSQLLINKRNTFWNALQAETLQRQITTCLTCDKVFQVSVYIHMYFPPETPGSDNERFLLAMYVYW